MIKIKLAKNGAKNRASYRIIASEKRSKLNGKNLGVIGFYDPKTKPATVKIDKEILNGWLKKGAQLTPAVRKLLL